MNSHPSFDPDRPRTATPGAADVDSPRTAVVAAIADVRGVDPLDVDVQLQRAVDTDVIDTLAAHEGGDWRLEFRIGGHDVTLDSDGAIVVDGHVFSDRLDA